MIKPIELRERFSRANTKDNMMPRRRPAFEKGAIGTRSFEVMVTHGLVDDIATVSEEEIAEATRVAWLRLKLALEPTGALPLAAHLAGKLPESEGPIGLVLSGGNADPSLVARLLRTR